MKEVMCAFRYVDHFGKIVVVVVVVMVGGYGEVISTSG